LPPPPARRRPPPTPLRTSASPCSSHPLFLSSYYCKLRHGQIAPSSLTLFSDTAGTGLARGGVAGAAGVSGGGASGAIRLLTSMLGASATTGNYYCCKRRRRSLQLAPTAATFGAGGGSYNRQLLLLQATTAVATISGIGCYKRRRRCFGCPALVLWAHHVLLLWVAGVATLVRRICYFGQPELLPNFLEALLPAAALFMPWVAGVAAKFYARYCQDKLMLRPGGG
jgi:hypothetical protein